MVEFLVTFKFSPNVTGYNGFLLFGMDQDPRWQVGDQYTPVDAIAQGLKSASLSDTKTLAQTLSNWFRRLEA